jgi:hypothetical protein
VILRLAVAELRHRPGRALFLLGGYALGVAVMVVLLAVGEAMLEQSRDPALVGGGDLVVLPAGMSVEMLRTGGVETLFLGIDNARFLQREVLEGPRAREDHGITAASPTLTGRAVELLTPAGPLRAVAHGEIPSRAAAVGAPAGILAGRWEDSPADRRWTDPTAEELFREIDRFHLPRGETALDSTWAEWHYFNVVLDEERWVYATLMVGGRMALSGEWGGRVLLTVRDAGGHRSHIRDVPGERIRIDTLSPDLRFDDEARVAMEGGVYRVRATAGNVRLDLEITPSPRRYFPPADLGGEALVSGYTVPALHATARGTVCTPACERVEGARAYHDHNWGTWRDVAWEWGTASDERVSLLYGVVRGPEAPAEGIFAYLVDERGPRALWRAGEVRVVAWQTARVDGRPVRVPRRMTFEDARQGARVTIEVGAAHVTDLGRERDRYFVQMRGEAVVEEAGREPLRLDGFFETYVDGGGESGGTGGDR